jgi:gliding motility-associated-like protein
MMKRILLLLMLTSGILQVANAQNETIVISAQEYGELKAAGELEEGAVYVMEESLSDEELHPDVYDADLQATAGRDAACDCWVEPDNTYATLNLSDDASSSLIPLPFDFCLYGNTYSSLYINANGNVTFGNAFGTYTPAGFPVTTPMVAPFWADVNLSEGGNIRYKVTSDAIYINWMDAGYFGSNAPNQTNTFQVILTNGENDFVGLDRNVSFCYQDMQWTTGTASSGTGGFGGSPATVGANEGAGGTSYIQFGRFNQNNDNYDGPFGTDDGVDYLDDQSFAFSACADFSNNVPPVATGIGNCDTLLVCQGETVEFSTQFLAPENNQDVTITFDDGGADGFSDIEIIDGDIGEFNASFTGSLSNVGTYTVTITATDSGSPAASTSVTITIIVTEQEIPLFEISGDTSFCGGGSTILYVPEGFDEYNWNTDCEGDSCEVDQTGTYTVQGILGGCDATASIDVEEGDFFLPPVQVANQPICSNDSTLVTSVNEYESYSWSVYQDFPGAVYSDDSTGQTVYLSSGTYALNVETAEGCIGQRIFNVSSTDAFIPEDDVSGLYCDGPQEIEFFGAYSDATNGSITMFLINTQEPGWQGGSVDVFIDGVLIGNYTLETGNQTSYSIPITYGQYVEIIYNSGSNDSGNLFNFTNCGGSPVFTQPGIAVNTIPSGVIFEGLSGCDSDPAFGSWSVNGPDYEITNNDEEDNDYDIIFDAQDYGQYELCFTDSVCGIEYCYDVEISEEPGVQLDEEVLVCDEDEFVIEPVENDPADDATGQWDTGDPEGPLTVTESDTYCYTLSNECGQETSCIEVVLSSTPDPMLSDTLVCGGTGSVILDPIENDPGYVYSWTGGSADGSTDPQVEATEPDTYTVTVTSLCGSEEAVAEVSIFPGVDPVIQTDNTLICDGTSAELELSGQIGGDILWSTNETSNSILVDESGQFCVTVSNECESAEDCIEITIAEDPTVDILNEDFILCAGDPQTLQASATGSFGGIYIWTASFMEGAFSQTGESFSVFSDDIPQDFLGGPIPYMVTVSGPCGTASDEVFVTPVVCNVIIPNIISPNNDNKNEGFYIEGIEYFSSVQLRIFDRWGKEVFSDDNYSNDDAWEAEDLNEGVYYYTLVLPTEDFSGYITVVR